MCVYIYLYECVCIYVCVNMYMNVCIYARLCQCRTLEKYVRTNVHTYIHTYIHTWPIYISTQKLILLMHACIHTCIHTFSAWYMCMCKNKILGGSADWYCMYASNAYIYIYIYIYIYRHAFMHTYMNS